MSSPETASQAASAAVAADLERRNDYWSVVLRQFHKNKLGYVGLAFISILSLIAIFAPFLADNRPILLKMKGELSSPLLKAFTPTDWFLFLGFIIGAGSLVAFRLLRRRKWERGRAVGRIFLVTAPIWILVAIFSLTRKDYIDPRDYWEESQGFQAGEWVLFPLVPFSYDQQNLMSIYLKPGDKENRGTHWLGTDSTGRDIMARLIHGSRISLSVGFVAVGIYIAIGTFVGALAGYYGGKVDAVLSRFIEIIICFPTLFLILTVLAVLPQSIFTIMAVIGVTRWPDAARLVRAEFLKQKSLDYVSAARALGAAPRRVIFRHILPNAMSPVFVSATFGIAGAILIESALSFLGLGVPPPAPSWGQALSSGRAEPLYWWLAVFPGAAIFITMTSFNLLGEALRDALDPRLKT
ncbi:MAG TPA: ABC transporter permease [Planctomycetota bacterium]|nr:ABC transporter permease [Planctomycetota bacterium]